MSRSEKLPASYLVAGALIGGMIGWWSTTGFKSQSVRLVDVIMIGPLMIYAAYLLTRPGCTLRDKRYLIVGILIAMVGGSTITYNLKNYLVQNTIKEKIGELSERVVHTLE